jgi:hypothetical protein
VHVGEQDHLPPWRVEGFEAAAQSTPLGQAKCRGLRALVLAGQTHGLEVVDKVRSLLAAQNVESPVAEHRVKPAARIAPRQVEGRGLVPDLNEGVVHGFFRKGAAAQQSERDAQHAGSFQIVDRAQRRFVAARATAQRVVEAGAPRSRARRQIRKGS